MSAPANSGRKLFYGLFIFPLVIAVGMALFLCAVVLMTHEEETPESLISAIKSGSPSKRWQKAFELSNELNAHPQSVTDPLRGSTTLKEIIAIFRDSTRYDPKTRGYMAVVLSHFRDPQAVAALRDALREEHPEVLLFSMWSLGRLEAKETMGEITPFLKSDEPSLRQMAIYVSGVLGDVSIVPTLKSFLTDASADIRWNAALALARLGSNAGYETLLEMLDRQKIDPALQMDEEGIEKIKINAIRGLVLIRKPESIKILESVSKNDGDLKVRQTAMDALAVLKEKTTNT